MPTVEGSASKGRTDLRLRVIGPFRGATGYGRHTRELARHLIRLGVRVELHDLQGWSRPMPEGMREAWFDTLAAPVDASAALHFVMPTQVQPSPGMRNVNYTMFEAARIPAQWAARAARVERVVVPAESSRLAWAASGVPEAKLRVAPLGVDASFFGQQGDPLALRVGERPLGSYRCRFLNVAELRPRKNHLGLIRSWIRATSPGDDAVLLLKTITPDRHVLEQLMADLTEMLARLGRGLDTAAPLVLIPDLMSNELLRSLYHACSHYISMSRGEGWDLPMMEAAVAGLHLIAPRHSAYLSYLRDEDAELLPSPLVPVTGEGKMRREDLQWFDGLSWWQPDEDAAVEVLARIIRGHAPEKASPKARIASEYTWDRAARALLEALDD